MVSFAKMTAALSFKVVEFFWDGCSVKDIQQFGYKLRAQFKNLELNRLVACRFSCTRSFRDFSGRLVFLRGLTRLGISGSNERKDYHPVHVIDLLVAILRQAD